MLEGVSILDKFKRLVKKDMSVYAGFPLVKETEIEGFINGEITDHFDFDEEEYPLIREVYNNAKK